MVRVFTGLLLVMLVCCGRVGFEQPVTEPCHAFDLQIDVKLAWNTFLGGNGIEYGHATAVDGSGNVYVGGQSGKAWGSPVRPFGDGNWDAFVVKLDSGGNLLWHTFLGQTSAAADGCLALTVDSDGDVIASGFSTESWGTPIRAHAAGATHDAFVARLDTNGNLLWHTFLGGSGEDIGHRIALDASGSIYVSGYSGASWGTPVRAFAGGRADAFAARLDTRGNLLWHAFLGGSGEDQSKSLALESSGMALVSGYSESSWGAPVRAFDGGGADAFVARIDSSGTLLWNTFLGGDDFDDCRVVAQGANAEIYAGGFSQSTWGTPVRIFTGGSDGFAARLDSSGKLLWNTFLGGNADDVTDGLAISTSGAVYLSGYSRAGWGAPVRDYSGGAGDAFAVRLDSNGNLVWSLFLGSSGSGHPFDDDYGNDLTLDAGGNIHVAGGSSATWGVPRRALSSGERDAFSVRIVDETASVCREPG